MIRCPRLPERRYREIQSVFLKCRREKVEPELEASFREAIDMAIVGSWEPDQPLEIEGPRWQYDVYVSPSKEAA